MGLSSFSVKKKVTITMLTLIIVLMGSIAFIRLGVDFFPEIELPTISVATAYTGASPEDIEEMLTRPLEKFISTVSNVKQVSSNSKEGVSIINVEFEWGTNLDFAAQDIRETIGMYRSFLPDDIQDPVVMKFSMDAMPVMMYGIRGDRPVPEIEQLVDEDLAAPLERIEGVASVMVFSAERREVKVILDQEKIARLGISPDQILQIIRMENVNQPAGHIVEQHTEYIIRTVGEFPEIKMIEKIPVGYTREGTPIKLSEVARVEFGLKEVKNLMSMHGKKGVMLIVTKSSGANSVTVAQEVKEEIRELEKYLPEDVELFIAMDMSEAIVQSAQGTGVTIILGGILVIALIFMFLSSWRPTLTIVISIPLSIIATFISFYVAGYTLNLITLIGLGLGVGMLVDNSIVVIENIFRHLEEGEDADSAAMSGAREVSMAITASTLTTIGVFFPMLFASGVIGKLTQALALSVCFALVSSLFVALTIVPMLTSVLFRGIDPEKLQNSTRRKSFEKYKAFYQKLLVKALRHKGKVLAGVLALLVLSLVMLNFAGFEFMPTTDHPMLLMKLKLPVGTDLDTTSRIAKEVEANLMAREEILTVGVIVGVDEQDTGGGGSEEFNPQGAHEAIFWVRLVPKLERKFTGPEIGRQIKNQMPPYAGGELEIMDMSQMMSGGSSYPIDVKIKGDSLEMLKQLAQITRKAMEQVEGFSDVHTSFQEGKKEIHIEVDREKAYLLGLTVYDVASTVHTYTLGKAYSKYTEQGKEYDIRVLMESQDRRTLRDLKNFPIVTRTGNTVYLGEVADLTLGEGPLRIDREDQVRKISVLANIQGRDLGSAMRELKLKMEVFEDNLPQGYFIEYGGQYEDMQSGFKDLGLALLVALILVYMIMASQFEHLLHPFVIMFTIPLTIIGVLLALVLTGTTINVVVFMGFIILAGIAVNNGIVMVDYINQLRDRGLDAFQAVVEGAVTRLRPVLITALSTIFGMLPMIFTRSEGAGFRVPLGVSIVGGLVAATFLTLLVIPIVYSLVNKIRYPELKG